MFDDLLMIHIVSTSIMVGVICVIQLVHYPSFKYVKESDYIVILDPPEIPIYRSKPNKRLMVIISALLGIGLGIVLAFIREYTQNRDPDEHEKMDKVKSLILKNITDFLPRRFKKN